MGYYEVLNWLVNKRASGDDSFFTTPQIIKGLKEQGFSDNGVGGHLLSLEYHGYVEAKMNFDIKNWLRKYRASNSALNSYGVNNGKSI